MLKIYPYRELEVSQKPTGDYENNLYSYLEALEALKTTLIGVKTKKVPWANKWRFPANIKFLEARTSIVQLYSPNYDQLISLTHFRPLLFKVFIP